MRAHINVEPDNPREWLKHQRTEWEAFYLASFRLLARLFLLACFLLASTFSIIAAAVGLQEANFQEEKISLVQLLAFPGASLVFLGGALVPLAFLLRSYSKALGKEKFDAYILKELSPLRILPDIESLSEEEARQWWEWWTQRWAWHGSGGPLRLCMIAIAMGHLVFLTAMLLVIALFGAIFWIS